MILTRLKNQKGQFLIEAILLMVVTVGLISYASKTLKDKKVVQKLISGNWPKISGMIETGVWAEPSKARSDHPNQIERGVSYDPAKL